MFQIKRKLIKSKCFINIAKGATPNIVCLKPTNWNPKMATDDVYGPIMNNKFILTS